MTGRVRAACRERALPRLATSALLLCLLAAVRLPGEWRPSETTVALYTTFQHEMPPAAEKAMRDEVDWITSPIGVKFAWRTFGGADRQNAVARLAVVHFKGHCDTQNLTVVPVAQVDSWKLGWTHAVDGNIVPYADIFCDLIRTYISPTLSSIDQTQRDAIYGRAVGRVLAHELYHVFAETRKHALTGLAKAACTEGNLVSDNFSFSSNELRNLRTILASTMLLATSTQFPPPEAASFLPATAVLAAMALTRKEPAQARRSSRPGCPRL